LTATGALHPGDEDKKHINAAEEAERRSAHCRL
jgi:hypothetical protein